MSDEFEQAKLEFPFGLLGFEDYKHFTLEKSEYKPFCWLMSDDDKSVSFLVVDPFAFFPDFEIDVDDATLFKIGVNSPSDVIVLTIITIAGKGQPITANLQGPLVLNKSNHQAMQVILSDPKYTTKHPISTDSVKGGSAC